MNDQQLMNLLKFEKADLQANRNGRISEKQMAQLRTIETAEKRSSLLGGAGNAFVALIGVAGAALVMTEESLGFKIIFGGIFGILWPLFWGSAALAGLRRGFVKVDATLKKAAGTVSIEKITRSDYNSDSQQTTYSNVHEMRIGGYTFIVNPALQNYIRRGDSYAVYFAEFNHKERSREVLSLELLAKARESFVEKINPLDDAEITDLVEKGDMMEAIRLYRTLNGSSFEEARSLVEDIQLRLG